MRALRLSEAHPSERMFKSDFFEFFSRIPPWQPPVLFLPIIAWNLFRAFALEVSFWLVPIEFLLGVTIWTLLEYWLHRIAFHYEAKSVIGKKLVWFLHGVHHDWPNDKLRLVFPPALSIPLAILFFALMTVSFGEVHRYGIFSGLAFGYLSYDMIHYFVHHFAPKSKTGKFLRKYHMGHHFKDPTTGYGVSSPLWDYVFGTRVKSPQE